MKEYREKMEKIQPSPGLETAVLARARAGGGRKGGFYRVNKLTAVLIAAILGIALCVGIGASAVHLRSVLIPGVGITDVVVPGESSKIWVLDEVVPLGSKQIDYILLYPDEGGYSLRVILTNGPEEIDVETGKYTVSFSNGLPKDKAKETSFFGTLTAVLPDGTTAELMALDGDPQHASGYYNLDSYACKNISEQTSFVLRSPQGDEAAVTLVEYIEKERVIEKSNADLTVRMLPFAKGSRYLLYDGRFTLLDEKWVPEVYNIPPIDEAGNKLTVSVYADISLGVDYVAGDFETLIALKQYPTERIVDCSINSAKIASNYHFNNDQVIPLPVDIPSKGERVTFEEPVLLFEDGEIKFYVESMYWKDDLLRLKIAYTRYLENGFSVRCRPMYYLRAEDGTYYTSEGGSAGGMSTDDMTKGEDRFCLADKEGMGETIYERIRTGFGDECGIYFYCMNVRLQNWG